MKSFPLPLYLKQGTHSTTMLTSFSLSTHKILSMVLWAIGLAVYSD